MGKQGIRKRKKRGNVTVSQRSTTLRFIRKNLSWFSYGLTYFIIGSMILMLMFAMSGCGHSFVHIDKGKGAVLRIPLPDGGSLVDFKVGMIDSTTAVIRGNTTYDSSASTGGASFTSAGTADRIFLSTGMQLNEGYLKDVLTDPSVDTATKVELAKVMAQMKPTPPRSTVTKTVSAASSSGGSATDIEPMKVGLDNVVDKVAQVAPKVVEPVAKATAEVVKDAAVTTQKVSKDWSSVMNRWWIIALTGLIIIGAVVAFVLKRFKKQNSTKETTSNKEDVPVVVENNEATIDEKPVIVSPTERQLDDER